MAKNPFAALSGGADDYTKSVSSGVNNRVQQLKDIQSDNDRVASQSKSAPSKSSGPATGAKYGDKAGEKRIDTSKMTKPLGSFKKGGKVPKTGLYKLHAGEQVMNKKQTGKMKQKGGMAALFGKGK